jgi:FkbM family methyltransferase
MADKPLSKQKPNVATLRAVKPRVLSRLNLRLYRAISDNRHRRVVSGLANGAGKYLAAFEHTSADAHFNGEYDLLDRLTTTEAVVIVDCGANIGTWALAAASRFPNATIHAFEPIPETVVTLEQATATVPKITVHRAALSDTDGVAVMAVDDADRATASLAVAATSPARRNVEVIVTTGDSFMTAHSIDRVRLLKIDAEGHDLVVLRGFEDALSRQLVDIIQFEVSGWNAVTRTWVGEFYDLLNGHGYDLGRVVPGAAELGPYASAIENFSRTSNFVAVRRSASELATGVAGNWRR